MQPGDSRWPALYNVILVEGFGRTVEIDHLVRVPDGILVLETKTYAGFIDGGADAPYWTQHLAGGRCTTILNPAIQNLGQMRAVERFVAEPVRAGPRLCRLGGNRAVRRCDRAPPRASQVLRGVLRKSVQVVAIGQEARVDAAWQRIEREPARGAGRRAAHEAYGRRRPDECRRSACGANFRVGAPVPLHGRVRGRYGCADPRKTQSVT